MTAKHRYQRNKATGVVSREERAVGTANIPPSVYTFHNAEPISAPYP